MVNPLLTKTLWTLVVVCLLADQVGCKRGGGGIGRGGFGAHLQLVQAPHHVEVLRLAAVAVASSEEAVLAAAVADRVDTRRLEADMR
ncbi:hypothetical protein AAVH_40163, partial [Aphelenchoides avenae]